MASYNAGRVQGFAGWTEQHTFSLYGSGDDYKVVKKLTDYINGEGNKPTANIGLYVADDNDYTADISLAQNFRGQRGQNGLSAYEVAIINGFVGNEAAWLNSLIGPKGNQGIPGISTSNMAANSILGNDTGATGTPKSLSPVGLTLSGNKVYNAVAQGVVNTKIFKSVNIPTGLYKSAVASETGAIKIKLPSNSSAMYVIKGTIMQYDATLTTNRTTSFMITTYASSMTNNWGALFLGANQAGYNVRWYLDVATPYIAIGDLTQEWSYLAFSIDEVQVSFAGANLDFATSGWEVSIITAFTGTLQRTKLAELNLPQSNQTQILSGFVKGANLPVQNTDTKAQRDGKFQGQIDALKEFALTKATNFTNGFLITTNIPITSSLSYLLKFNGSTGGNLIPFSGKIQGFNTTGSIITQGGFYINTTGISTASIFVRGGFICFWHNAITGAAINDYMLTVSGPSAGYAITSITNVVKPLDISLEVVLTPVRPINNNGSASNLILGDGSYKLLTDFSLKSEATMYRLNNAIAGGVNLNTLTTTSFNIQRANGSATLALNYPVEKAGILVVYAGAGGTDYMNQQYYVYDSGETYSRSLYGTTWSTWKKTVFLGPDNKIPIDQIPATAIVDVFAVASQAAMLALTAQKGDIAIRSDISKTFVLSADPATTLGNWLELLSPTGGVTSVGGFSGTVTKAQLAIDQVNNTSDANKPISTAQQAALDTKAPIRYSSIIVVSANKTLALSDENTYQRVTATCSITVPPNSSVALPVGARIDFLVTATFVATFVEGSGVTITKKTNLLATGYSACTIIKTGTNTWDLIGN